MSAPSFFSPPIIVSADYFPDPGSKSDSYNPNNPIGSEIN